jgi:glucose-6-phosphate dehydrogenase assembly protein OpcA
LGEKHPARTIVVTASDQPANMPIDAAVGVRARKVTNGRTILHELVHINAGGDLAYSLPSILRPLLITNLPTYLWWHGEPPVGHPFWQRMIDTWHRVILNSAEFARPFDGMALLANFCSDARAYHTVGDLSWTRLAPWRDMFAQIFDNQRFRPFLDGIDMVTIEYSGGSAWEMSGGSASPCTALLLVGWLSSRLGWKTVNCEGRQDGFDVTLLSQLCSQTITVQLRSRLSAGTSAANLESIRFNSTSHGTRASFEISRNAHVARVIARIDGVIETTHSVRLMDNDLADLLAQQFDTSGQDETFDAALAHACEIASLASNVRST